MHSVSTSSTKAPGAKIVTLEDQIKESEEVGRTKDATDQGHRAGTKH